MTVKVTVSNGDYRKELILSEVLYAEQVPSSKDTVEDQGRKAALRLLMMHDVYMAVTLAMKASDQQ